ncbi:MAG TPA: nicotinate (nicotinamide) nucleotide adenylyltransferase, partial [Balneolaceae bacterium]|nr:nicotinate (nicotinamide) nucleotide adenylyltransferase [Balneolaceae bacterium]
MGDDKQGIGLLGGSFDPVHNGHLAIAQSFLESEYISELWVLPAPDPPHKKHSLTNYDIRLKMLKVAFGQMDDVCINEVEKKLSYPSYTVQTVKYLNEKHPDSSFFLCIGEDSAVDFTEWFQWQEILDYCNLLIARRSTTDGSGPNEKVLEKVRFVSHQPVDISSTEIRKRAGQGKDISTMVPEG